MANNTKQTIALTYAELIGKKNIDRVTVKDVSEACGITRQTFYYHFQDLLDVIEWSIRYQIDKIMEKSHEEENVEALLSRFLRSASTNRPLVRKILASQKRYQIDALIINSVKEELTRLVEKKYAAYFPTEAEKTTAIQFYTYAICGTLLETVMNDDVDFERKAHQVLQLIRCGCVGITASN